ncbi:hypothetical protein QL285_070931 [Trifolium repens]|nr:hypothetical protein QL285_070931 [Trifolium repens]
MLSMFLFHAFSLHLSIGDIRRSIGEIELDWWCFRYLQLVIIFLKNDAACKYVGHAFKLNFISGTSITPLQIPDMPVSGFKYKKFEKIQAFEFREDLLYDLIGAVHEIGSAQTTAFAGKLNIPFTREGFGNVILCKFPMHGLELSLSSMKILPADNTYATQNQLLPSSSQSFSAQSSAAGSQMSLEGQFIQEHRVLKQIDIIRLNKDEIVITVVTTSHLRPLAEDVPILRIDVQVHDGDDNAKFVFWDNTCIELLGITAGELQKNMLEVGEDDLLLDEMMGRTFAFRVKWQKEWRQGPVLEIKDDKQLAGKIQQQLAASPWHAPIFTSVWKCPAPSKVSGFVWQLLHGRVPTRNNLITRRILAVEEDVSCALCGEEKETELHLFLYCENAVQKGTQKLGMHIPRGAATVTLKDRDEVVLVSEDTHYAYFCKILSNSIQPDEMYITRTWHRYLDRQRPKLGDLLKFELDETNQYLMICRFPANQH